MLDLLIQERDQLLKQREALNNQIIGLERAISLAGGEEPIAATKPSGRRVNNKGIVLKLLEEAGTTGLNAVSAVEMASRRGVSLDRNSVSSLLSRLKADNIVVYDGDRYRLANFSHRPERHNAGDVVEMRMAS